MKTKHRNDKKHTPGGRVGGNRRHKRNRRGYNKGDETMGRVKESRY